MIKNRIMEEDQCAGSLTKHIPILENLVSNYSENLGILMNQIFRLEEKVNLINSIPKTEEKPKKGMIEPLTEKKSYCESLEGNNSYLNDLIIKLDNILSHLQIIA